MTKTKEAKMIETILIAGMILTAGKIVLEQLKDDLKND